MDVWATLGQWAEKRLKAITITLIQAPAEQRVMVGQMAALGEPRAEAQGPLVSAPFWEADWAAALGEAAAGDLPEGGLLVDSGGRRYLVSRLAYVRSALVLGGGHVGSAVGRLLRFLDFEVTLMDDRSEFLQARDDGAATVEASFDRLTEFFAGRSPDAVIIVTRGHAQDTSCLRQVLAWPGLPPYLGMIGSRHRTSATLKMLAGEGVAPDLLKKIHTPIGLKIGAQTPAEIAVAIVAEIIQELRAAEAE